MAQTCGISPEELHVREGEFTVGEDPLETAWTFWYDKKTTDRKESDQYMEGLKQLGSFNTVQGFYRHYSYLLRPSEFPRDHNVLMFRKGYKPMWEEFPEGGCWIIRIKRKVSQSYVNRMWENLLLACIGEAFEMPDVVGCVLSTRLKDDVLSVWNLSNRDTPARFRIGEKLKEILDLDMNALIQYKDHMQSLQDYSTYRNAKNYMFAPSPGTTPLMGNLETPVYGHTEHPTDDFDQGMLPPAAIDEMLPPAAVDTEGFGYEANFASRPRSESQATRSPALSAAAAPWSPGQALLSADAPPWTPKQELLTSPAEQTGKSPALSHQAAPWFPPSAVTGESEKAASAAAGESEEPGDDEAGDKATDEPKSWASIAAAAAKKAPSKSPQVKPSA